MELNNGFTITFAIKHGIRHWLLSGWLLLIGLITISSFANLSLAQTKETPAYRFGVFPHLPPTRLEKTYASLAADFGRILNRSVQLGTASDFEKFLIRIQRNDFDIAMISPMDIKPVVDEGGYIPLARRPSHPACIVVLDENPMQRLDSIRGKTIGLPAHTPASILLQLNLSERGLTEDQDIHFQSFTNVSACLQKLLVKKIDACGSGSGTALKIFEKKMGIKLRVLMKTPPFPHMLFVANPRLPPAERKSLIQTILNWDKTEQGRELLNNIGPKARFIPYRSEDYDIIRHYHQRWQEHVQNTP